MTKVRDLVRSDRGLTVRMISSVLNLNRQTVHKILTFELDTQKTCAKLVPKILTNEQKENGRNVCLDFLERNENDKFFFKRVITGDETWIFEYDSDTRRQFEVAHEQLTAPKESKNEQIKNQNHANLFFRQSRRCS